MGKRCPHSPVGCQIQHCVIVTDRAGSNAVRDSSGDPGTSEAWHSHLIAVRQSKEPRGNSQLLPTYTSQWSTHAWVLPMYSTQVSRITLCISGKSKGSALIDGMKPKVGREKRFSKGSIALQSTTSTGAVALEELLYGNFRGLGFTCASNGGQAT
jgi:hypothetical protein